MPGNTMKKNDVQKLNKHVKSKSEVGKDPKKIPADWTQSILM